MKVSIITVAFNSASTINDTILSVAFQDYSNIEYIIIDGGSKDRTLEIIAKNSGVVSKWISEPDKGLYDAMNKGIKMATGDIVGIINSDDFYHKPNAISKIVETFKKNNVQVVFADIVFVDKINTDKVVRYYSSSKFKPWKMRFGFIPAHPTFFTSKVNFEKFGYYNIDYKIGADFELLLRFLVKHKLTYKYLSTDLMKMRIGGISTSSIKSTYIIVKENLKAFKENQLYSNYLFLILRYFIKVFHFIPFRNKWLMNRNQ